MDGMLLEAEARHSIVVLICIVVLSALDCPKLKRREHGVPVGLHKPPDVPLCSLA